MTFTGMPPLQAPTTSGHPASLPSLAMRKEPSLRVEPSAKGGETAGTALRQGHTPPQPNPARREGRENASAPPTILQIKIGEMLREQAEAIKDPADEVETRTPRTDPSQYTKAGDAARDTADAVDTSAAPRAEESPESDLPARKQEPATAPVDPEARS